MLSIAKHDGWSNHFVLFVWVRGGGEAVLRMCGQLSLRPRGLFVAHVRQGIGTYHHRHVFFFLNSKKLYLKALSLEQTHLLLNSLLFTTVRKNYSKKGNVSSLSHTPTALL